MVFFMPRSSSGPGHRPLTAKIMGSTPIRGTKIIPRSSSGRTADSGSANLGSNPSLGTIHSLLSNIL